MAKLIGEDWTSGVRERWYENTADNSITIEHAQDLAPVLKKVADINSEGAPTVDGLGHATMELPYVIAMEYCRARGIDVNKFIYSREYDGEFKRLAQDYSRFVYTNHRRAKSA